jgi:S-adenosyl-L-methionine hydrolase (adenosine-forming)
VARPHIVTLTTDFGLVDHYAGAIKGALLSVFPEARIADITHAVQAFDVLDGALAIAESYSYFPSGSVHMVVVDPGVGSERRPILATVGEHYFVAPDNGVLSLVYAQADSVMVREITSSHYFRQPVSSTFHGRDVFAPVAANLAKGVDPAKFGDEITDYVRFAAPQPKAAADHSLRGIVLKIDRYGNLITNIRASDAPQLFGENPPPFRIVAGKETITEMCNHYAQGAPGELFAIVGSMGYLEISTNRGTAAKLLGIGKGAVVSLWLEGAAAASSHHG